MSIDITISSQGAGMKSEEDEILIELREAIDPTLTKIDADLEKDRAVLVIGAAVITDSKGEDAGAQTYVEALGEFSLLQEALYDTLTSQIQSGNSNLFQTLREVIQAIENDFDLEPGEIIHNPIESRMLH